MNSVNCYEDANRARAYATLEFANTYYLAFREPYSWVSETKIAPWVIYVLRPAA